MNHIDKISFMFIADIGCYLAEMYVRMIERLGSLLTKTHKQPKLHSPEGNNQWRGLFCFIYNFYYDRG